MEEHWRVHPEGKWAFPAFVQIGELQCEFYPGLAEQSFSTEQEQEVGTAGWGSRRWGLQAEGLSKLLLGSFIPLGIVRAFLEQHVPMVGVH